MINEQLLQYIKSQRDAGTPDEEIKDNLKEAGWRSEDIEDGFQAVSGDGTSPQSHQEVRKEAANSAENQAQNSQRSENKSGSKNTNKKRQETSGKSQDAYREPVDAEGKGVNQQSQSKDGATHQSQARSANEEPMEVRTMQSDTERAGHEPQKREAADEISGDESSSTSRNNQQSDQSEQTLDDAVSKVQEGVEKREGSSRKTSEQKQRSQKHEKQQKSPSGRSSKSANQSKSSRQDRSSSRAKRQKQLQRKQSPKQGRSRKQQSKIQEAKRKQSSSSGIATVILSILGLLLVGGGAAYAYITYFQGPNVSTNAQTVIQSLADAQSFQYRISVQQSSNQATSTGSANMQEVLVVEGAVDTDPSTDTRSYYTITRPTQDTSSAVTGMMAEFDRFADLDPRQQQSVNQMLADQQFMSVREFQTQQQLGANREGGGFMTNRFGVTLSPDQLAVMYSSVYETIFGNSLDQGLASQIQRRVSNFNPQQGQLWIDPDSSVPYQLTIIGSGPDGVSMQVNAQFKNHGQTFSGAPDSYETRSFADGLAQAFGIDATTPTTDQDDAGTDQRDDVSTSTDNQNQDADDDNVSTSTNDQQRRMQMRRQDQLRINDIQQIVVALRSYAGSNGEFPQSLSALAGGDVLSRVPRDPQTGSSYRYARVSSSRYHVGATMQATSQQQLPGDANFNSAGSANNGFIGNLSTCRDPQTTAQTGSTCYDRTGQISQ